MNHIQDNRATMVDVGDKPTTTRVAIARGRVTMQPATLSAIREQEITKGEVLQVARLAGIMAAKRTDELIPLCHSLGMDQVDVRFWLCEDPCSVIIEASARCQGKTGVEMEAMVAASTAAMTIYDMCKAIDRGMGIGPIYLHHKSGGKSGDFTHPDPPLSYIPDEPSWE